MLIFALGSLVSILGKKFSRFIMTSGAVLVTVMGLIMITQGGILSGIFQGTELNSQEVKINDELQIIHSTLSLDAIQILKLKRELLLRRQYN